MFDVHVQQKRREMMLARRSLTESATSETIVTCYFAKFTELASKQYDAK